MAKKKKGDEEKEVIATEEVEEYGSTEAVASEAQPEAMMIAQPKKIEEAAAQDGFPEKGIVDEISDTIRGAAGDAKVTVIRLGVGKDVTVSRVKIASELQRRFPGASVEITDGKQGDSVVVKDIEVE
jgi:hypothetical protein